MYCLKIKYNPKAKPWVARIVGRCKTYGLSREFVPQMKDYRSAFVGEQDPHSCFFLEPGEAYEVCENPKAKPSEKDSEETLNGRYYCRINNKNELERIGIEEVMAAVSLMEVVQAEVKEKKREVEKPRVVSIADRIYGGSRR